MLALMTAAGTGEVYSYFEGSASSSFTGVLDMDSTILGRKHLVRLYLPAGYEKNPLRRYPILYMQDGKNLFFPEAAWGRRPRLPLQLGLGKVAAAARGRRI